MKKEMLNTIREALACEADTIRTEINDMYHELLTDKEWLEEEVYNNPNCCCDEETWAWATACEEFFGEYTEADEVETKISEICHLDADDDELEELVYERGGNYFIDIWFNRSHGIKAWVA